MEGPKIVFRAPVDGRRVEDGSSHPSPHVKRRKLEGEVILVLEKRERTSLSPVVSDLSVFNEGRHRTVGRRRARAIPEKFERCSTVEDLNGDVYASVSETRSAPSPSLKSKSSDKTKGDVDDRLKHDAFDAAVDALLILGLEMKEMTKGFLPERDSGKLESKLLEYVAHLKSMEKMTMTKTERDTCLVDAETWEAVERGVHPDVHLMERSEALIQTATRNVRDAKIIDRLLEIGGSMPKPNDKGEIE